MRLSTRVRYGTRALCALARAWPRRTVSVAAIARQEGVSVKYLEQIAARLKAAGLVVAAPGARGGYALARPPAAIRMDAVFVALEERSALVDCVDRPGACPRARSCPTRPLWASLGRAILKQLSRTRLCDLVPPPRPRAGAP
jgi:Rrf2 family protein